MAAVLTPLKYLWAGPNTLLALHIAIGLWLCSLGLKPTPNQVTFRAVGGVFEVCGGLVTDFLKCMPTSGSWRQPAGAAAMTLGHVVFAVDESALDRTRIHERVHVRQYEKWGPFFILAYALASLAARCRGRHGYLANRFERQAYAVSHPETAEIA